SLPAVTLSGGTLTGPGTLTILGLFTWTGGSLTGGGRTVALGGIALSGNRERGLDGRTPDNRATATWTGGKLITSNNGTWNNLGGSSLLIQADNFFGPGFFPTGGAFNNAGTVRKQPTVGTTTINVPLNNTGTVEILSGTLNLGAGGTSSGTFTVA